MSQDEIRAKYGKRHDDITKEYYSSRWKVGEREYGYVDGNVVTREQFIAIHDKNWQDMDLELQALNPQYTYEAYRDLGELGEQIITRRTINRELTTTEIANLEVKHNVKIRRVL